MITTIVVGAGSSGGALAARLSEDEDERVILLEAGPDYPDEDGVPASLRDPDEYDLFGHDWGLEGYAIEPPQARPQFPYLRGRAVGGSSAVATAALRALPEDFDGWAAAGNEEWSWSSVLPILKRLENDLDFGDLPYHGDHGPVPIIRARRDEWPQMMHAFEAACIDLGHPACPDTNAPDATGVGPTPRNMTATLRASTLTTYLRDARARPNLEIRPDTHIDRVLFDGRRATGVVARRLADDTTETLLADRVVLCAGVVGSPHILMLSGIGPAEQLRRVGIAPLVDLPVGETLYDHAAFTLLGLASDPAPEFWGPRVQLVYTSDGGTRNDMWVRTALLPAGPMFQPPPGVQAAVWLSGVVGKPSSVGHVRIVSADPRVQPALHFNFFAERSDRERARTTIRMLGEMVSHDPLRAEISQVLTPGPDILASDDQLDEWLRQEGSTAYHGACTCRMGPPDDGRAVVSQRLAVHGTECLFVADASVLPEITTNATNLTCILIGERMAEILQTDGR